MESYADLHLHSTASDGILEPAVVVREAASRGVAGLSLTDHDTVAGLDEAAAEAQRLGLRFLAGCELSANEPGLSIHILAYGFDPADVDFLEFLADYREDRLRRAIEISDRLLELGVPLPVEATLREASGGVPTRAHVARALMREGLVGRIQEAFDRYLARDRPAFVEKRPMPPSEVIRRVHAAGGVTVLAHPASDFRARDMRRWVDDGLDGVEILHPRNREAERKSLAALADVYGLLRGGGSDWHGPDSGGAEPGSQKVPIEWMDAIEQRCSGLAAQERSD